MEHRRRRRIWTREEKLQIVSEARVAGARVAEVARRHGANANMVFKWLRDPQFGGEPAAAEFLSVEVASDPGDLPPAHDLPAPVHRSRLPARLALEERAGIIEIDLSCGSRVRVDAHVNDRALARVLRILRAGG
ncbi:MAG: transposase [Pontimonas sp.]